MSTAFDDWWNSIETPLNQYDAAKEAWNAAVRRCADITWEASTNDAAEVAILELLR